MLDSFIIYIYIYIEREREREREREVDFGSFVAFYHLFFLQNFNQ